MKNLQTRKTSDGSSFGWLIRQMSINQKSGRKTFRRRFVSGSIFDSPCPPGCYFQSETKKEPDTNLIRNVFRPLFWLIDICRISQSKLLPVLVFLVCEFFIRGKNADSLTLKIALYLLIFSTKNKTVSTITFNFLRD